MTGNCRKCGKKIQLRYIGAENIKKYLLVWIFSCILWLSPAILIIIISILLAEMYGPFVYFFAIIDVIIFHFWAMYYVIKGGLVEVKII